MFPGCATFAAAVVHTLFAVTVAVIGATTMTSGDSSERSGPEQSSTAQALDARWMW
ncbi:hypothetical protein [Streptomyces sp. NPDC056244]|uniref:hypothetical protein n=1 Tax=Streptomyces sp. NPDC056244 TaxID=3345762 RepID=UPI0035D716AE